MTEPITGEITENKDTADEKYRMGVIPELPVFANSIDSFVPANWTLLDSVKSDYNGDGLTDIVGVLDCISDNDNIWYPRILFAAFKTAEGKYSL